MKVLFIISIIFINLYCSAQVACDFSDDYSDAAPWTYFYNFGTGCDNHTQTGVLSITGGVLDYDNVRDANDTRMYRDMGLTLSDESWTANFDFNCVDIGTGAVDRVGDVLFGVSENSNGAYDDFEDICSPSDNDAIMVVYLSEYDPDPATTGLCIVAKDGTTLYSSYATDLIVIYPGNIYYCTLTRVSPTNVSLDVYNDSARTDLYGAIECYEIPATITDLHILQHGNLPQGSYLRVLTGSIDNTCIYNNTVAPFEITGPTTVCEGDPASYSTNFPGDITWDLPGGVDYTIIDEDSIIVTDWGGGGIITISAEIIVGCVTETIEYDVTIIPSDSTSETISICDGDTISVFGTDVSDAGTFTHTFTAITGCDSIHTITVELADTIYTSETLTICEGDTVIIFGDPVYLEGTYEETYLSAGGCDSTHSVFVEFTNLFETFETISICDGETVTIFGASESEPGDYSQTFVSTGGCDSIHTITLEVFPPIDVYFLTDTVSCGPEGITFYPIITGDIVSIIWTPSVFLSCDDCPNPFLIPDESGWYYITVTDNNGCTDMDSIYVHLDLSSLVEIPNAFSPNNDGTNDVFSIIQSGACDIYYFRIYNRWGEMIFETFDINVGWDGTYKNVDQEIGTYVYVIEALCENNKLLLAGNVTLVR